MLRTNLVLVSNLEIKRHKILKRKISLILVIKFPGRSDQYFPIFRLVGSWTKFWIFRWTDRAHAAGSNWEREWRYPRPATSWWQGEEWGRWTTRQVEPGGVEEWGGIEIFFFQQAGRDWKLSILQTAFNLAARWFVQWNKHWQLIASERESDQLGLVDGKTFGDEMRASTISLSLLNLCSFSFHDYRQCLIRNRLVWKCSP